MQILIGVLILALAITFPAVSKEAESHPLVTPERFGDCIGEAVRVGEPSEVKCFSDLSLDCVGKPKFEHPEIRLDCYKSSIRVYVAIMENRIESIENLDVKIVIQTAYEQFKLSTEDYCLGFDGSPIREESCRFVDYFQSAWEMELNAQLGYFDRLGEEIRKKRDKLQ